MSISIAARAKPDKFAIGVDSPTFHLPVRFLRLLEPSLWPDSACSLQIRAKNTLKCRGTYQRRL